MEKAEYNYAIVRSFVNWSILWGPALFLFGSTAHWLTAKKRDLMLRWAGVMVALIGAYNLYRHLVLAQCCPPFLPFS